MVICFTCDHKTKRLLDSLIANGSYSEYSEVIGAAVHNLAVLESAAIGTGSLVLNADSGSSVSDSNVGRTLQSMSGNGTMGAKQDASDLPPFEVGTIADTFRLSTLDPNPPEWLPATSLPDIQNVGDVPLDKWVFGQFSKFLPAKASCRALANLATEQPEGFDLVKISTKVAALTSSVANYLGLIDRREGLVRDEALVLGFPSNGDNADRSRLRYATQYVGALTNGGLTGMLFEFRLAGLAPGSKFNLTSAGWRFAALSNPALDKNLGERLSEDETAFLLSHIQQQVPAEHFAYETILRAIQAGHDTPGKLDEICKKHVPKNRENRLSDAFITTQRTGVVSRLNELGLIGRHRDGIRVSYFVTEQGNAYVDGKIRS